MKMKTFYIYTVAENKIVGQVCATNWVDARLEACKFFGYNFSEVFAAENPIIF